MKRPTLACVALLAWCTGCIDSELIENPLVDRWCGDHPCSWEFQGQIARVGSWHPNDYAVALVSDDATLYQVNAGAEGPSVQCIAFSLLANVEQGAKVYLELDFMDDGVVEYSKALPVGDYQPLQFHITPPTWFQGIRFALRKEGPGRVTLARLRASSDGSERCAGEPLPLDERPSGAYCEQDDECAIGRCELGSCADCVRDDDCPEGSRCGEQLEYVEFFSSRVPVLVRGCTAQGREPLASPCIEGLECASGICCEGACSECCGEQAACEGEQTCETGARPEVASDTPDLLMPHRCDPQTRRGGQGDYCLLDADCASGTCSEAVYYACRDADCLDLACVCRDAVISGGECE